MADTLGRTRTRWAAIGAAVAVTLGAGTIATVDAVQSSGERLTYVASEPCRLMNTRPGTNQVGPRTTPLPAGTPITVQARGAQGNCTATQLPADAKALQLNVTPVNATASTDITIWPSGPIPQASSVNPRPGPPVPNAVVATLDSNGTFQIQNKFGTIDMVIDVLGYFVDHNHDDRYYTEAEVDALLAANSGATTESITIGPSAFHSRNGASQRMLGSGGQLAAESGDGPFVAPLILPDGATIDSFSAYVWDSNTTAGIEVAVRRVSLDSGFSTIGLVGTSNSSSTNSTRQLSPTSLSFNTVDTEFSQYEIWVTPVGASTWGALGFDLRFQGIRIEYTLP